MLRLKKSLLKKLKTHKAPFDGDISCTLQQYEYEGAPAIGVYVNGEQIGNVPAREVKGLLPLLPTMKITDVYVIGGGTEDGEKLSYGARVKYTL